MKLKSWAEAQHGRAMALAKAIGVPPSFVSKILSGDKAIPAVHCKAIEAFTGGSVTCQEMRPDDWHKYWPELDSIAPPAVEDVAMKTSENATVDAADVDQAVIVAVLVAAPKVESAQQPDHRAIPTRRADIPSHYDHSDIDRRDEEGPTHLGRRASNGHAGDADSAQVV